DGRPIPMTQFPPAFPTAIAIGERASGLSAPTVARWLNALAMALTTAIGVALAYRITRSLVWATLAGALLVRPPMVFAHARLLAAPLAIAALATTVAATYVFLRRPSRFALAGVVVGGAVGALTRLPGVVPLVCASAALGLWSEGPTRRRLSRAVLVAV